MKDSLKLTATYFSAIMYRTRQLRSLIIFLSVGSRCVFVSSGSSFSATDMTASTTSNRTESCSSRDKESIRGIRSDKSCSLLRTLASFFKKQGD